MLKYIKTSSRIQTNQGFKNVRLRPLFKDVHFYRFQKVNYAKCSIKYRIEIAKKLMRSSRHLMIREIAQMVGYPDSAYFSRLFKNVTGMSPSEYQMRF